jgi:amino-acid N-acetyltransferase
MYFATATQADLENILELIGQNNLPKAGIAEHLHNFIVALEQDKIIGCAGLEIHSDAGLLRSVAVASDYQKQDLGTKLIEGILDLAAYHQLTTLSLLTETAKDYFLRFGFLEVSRPELPESLKNSAEFKGACPDSAVAMMVTL